MATIQFFGSGDAFGSGGRFQACIAIRTEETHTLLDCGATALIAMKRLYIDPNSVDAVIISHLHGDHFGGIPFLLLDGHFGGREKPLLIAGPPGMRERVFQAIEILYPGFAQKKWNFDLTLIELQAETPTQVGACEVTAYEVVHNSGAPSYALRVSCGGKIVGYSGDTQWVEALVKVAHGADLFICETSTFEKVIPGHIAYVTLCQHRSRLECRQLVLTHVGNEVLRRRDEITETIAEDGLIFML